MPGLHFDMMERCDAGPRVREGDFDNAIFPKVQELARKYEIEYDPEHVVASDDAAIELEFELPALSMRAVEIAGETFQLLEIEGGGMIAVKSPQQ